jgi:DNA ligase 1
MTLVSTLSALSATTKKNEKEQILIEAYVNGERNLFEGFKMAYDPLTTFGVAKVALIAEEDDDPGTLTFDDFKALAADLSSRRLTGHAARDAILDAASVSHVATWNQFYRRILLKDMGVGVETSTINKVLAYLSTNYPESEQYLIPVFGCMLAHDGTKHEKKIAGRKLLDIKIDGVRLISILDKDAGTVTQFTRNGKINDNFKDIQAALMGVLDRLKESIVLDGEVVSNSFQELMTQINRKDADTSTSRYALFDMIPLKDFQRGESRLTQTERHTLLCGLEYQGILQRATGRVVYIVPKVPVDLSTEDGKLAFKRFNREALEAGYEGVMVKDPDAPYIGKRSTAWLKIKPVIEVSLEVVDAEIGDPDGKFSQTLGALVCRGEDDGKMIEVKVGSGLTDEQRDEIWSDPSKVIGMIVEVSADAITKASDSEVYSLRFPRFKGWRGTEKGEKI